MNRYICEGIIRDIAHGKRVAVLVPTYYDVVGAVASVMVNAEGHYDHLKVTASDPRITRITHDGGGDVLFFWSLVSILGYRNIDTVLVPRGTSIDDIPVATRMTSPIREFLEY